MIPGLKAISLLELKALEVPRCWSVEGHLDEIPSLTPLRGKISAEHQGNILEVKGKIQTIFTHCCDRCLGEFNQRLSLNTEEQIWLGIGDPTPGKPNNSNQPDDIDALMVCLDPLGSFDPERWIFEQLSLRMPLVKDCGDDCPGPPQPSKKGPGAQHQQPPDIDPRWAALRKLISP
ncbi:MAG TPA: YceD family protein [Prochlorococcus sp.]